MSKCVGMNTVLHFWLGHKDIASMLEHFYLAANFFLDEFVLSLVAQDDVHLLCAWSTDIRACTHIHTHTQVRVK